MDFYRVALRKLEELPIWEAVTAFPSIQALTHELICPGCGCDAQLPSPSTCAHPAMQHLRCAHQAALEMTDIGRQHREPARRPGGSIASYAEIPPPVFAEHEARAWDRASRVYQDQLRLCLYAVRASVPPPPTSAPVEGAPQPS